MPKNDNRSSLKDYKPERKHFDPNVSQLFAENPKPPSTQKGLPENPTFNSQVMSKILSDTPQQQGNTSPSRKKKVEPPVEPPKEKITPTPGRKKVDNRPQDHKYDEMFAPKSPPLEMRSVEATQVGKIFKSNEYPKTQDLQKHKKKEKKHFPEKTQPDERYFSPAKAAAYEKRNCSKGFKNASKELTNTPETSIDALVKELHKAFGTRRKQVPPPETPMCPPHLTTIFKYDTDSNKKQVEYHPTKSKRRAASTTSRAEGSPRTPSRVASAEADASSRVASVEAAASSRKAGSAAGSVRSQRSISSRAASSIVTNKSSSEQPSEEYGSTIDPYDSSSNIGYIDKGRFTNNKSFKDDLGDDLRFENKELTRKVDEIIKRYKPNQSEEEAIKIRLEEVKSRRAARRADEEERIEAKARAEVRAKVTSIRDFLVCKTKGDTPYTTKDLDTKFEALALTRSGAPKKNPGKQDIVPATESGNETHEISGWCEKVSKRTGSAAQEGDLSLTQRLSILL